MDQGANEEELKQRSGRMVGILTKEMTVMNNVQFHMAQKVAECGTMKANMTHIDDGPTKINIFKRFNVEIVSRSTLPAAWHFSAVAMYVWDIRPYREYLESSGGYGTGTSGIDAELKGRDGKVRPAQSAAQ